jgi:hypothetical protein
MTRRIYEFHCSDGHVTEEYIDEFIGKTECSLCNKTATKVVSAVQCFLDPISGDFPGSTMRWAKNREYQIKREKREDNS